MSLYSHFSRLGYGKKTRVSCTVSRRNVNELTTALHTIVTRLSHLALSQKKTQAQNNVVRAVCIFFQLKENHLYDPFFQRNAGQNVCVCYYGRIASYPSP